MLFVGRYIHRVSHLILFCAFTLSLHPASARIINLPEEFSSIQEAVEAATSGDVIQINQHDVYFLRAFADDMNTRDGIRILYKNLKIMGTLPDTRVRIQSRGTPLITMDRSYDLSATSQGNALVVDHSNLELKNLVFEQPEFVFYFHSGTASWHSAAPIQVVSGKLSLDNVDITGTFKIQGDISVQNSTIRGYNRLYSMDYHIDPIKQSTSAMYLHNCQSPRIQIVNSEILCNTEIGSRALIVEQVDHARIHIEGSLIASGVDPTDYNLQPVVASSWLIPDKTKGLAGIRINSCTNLVFAMHGSRTVGGSSYTRLQDQYQKIPGGPGMEIIDSANITIQEGECIGGTGGDGQLGLTINEVPPTPVHSGDGGNGMFMINSNVFLNSVNIVAGLGGKGDSSNHIEAGKDGQLIYQDENSTLVINSQVINWNSFR